MQFFGIRPVFYVNKQKKWKKMLKRKKEIVRLLGFFSFFVDATKMSQSTTVKPYTDSDGWQLEETFEYASAWRTLIWNWVQMFSIGFLILLVRVWINSTNVAKSLFSGLLGIGRYMHKKCDDEERTWRRTHPSFFVVRSLRGLLGMFEPIIYVSLFLWEVFVDFLNSLFLFLELKLILGFNKHFGQKLIFPASFQ